MGGEALATGQCCAQVQGSQHQAARLGLVCAGLAVLTPYCLCCNLYTTQWWPVLSAFFRSDQDTIVTDTEAGDCFRP